MRVDLLPVLAQAAGVDPAVAAETFERARESALKRRGGRDDILTFVLAVEEFRASHPFDITAVDAARKVQDVAHSATPKPA